MAVTKGETQVNGGATSWTNAHVMSALETVFSDLGFNSGTAVTGVPIACIQPGYTTVNELNFDNDRESNLIDSRDQWRFCGGPAISPYAWREWRLYVTNNGTTDYQIAQELIPQQSGVDVNNNTITVTRFKMTDGTKVTYAPTGGPGTDAVLTGLTQNTVYYIKQVDYDKISLHPTPSDAINNTNIVNLTNNPTINDPLIFRTDAQANPTFNIKSGDKLSVVQNLASGNFVFLDYTAGGYEADRVLNSTNVHDSTMASGLTGTGSRVDPWIWNTAYWPITESEPYDPTKNTDVGYTGIHSWGYGNDAGGNAALTGSIVIEPAVSWNSYGWYDKNYWKVTVPASGGRSELKLRVYRHSSTNISDYGSVCGIAICSQGSGWNDNDSFTILGSDIGGVSPDNDITFGVNAQGTGTDGTPNIITTNLGAGTDFFQKHPDGDYAVLRLENNAAKKFGTTYWGFSLRENSYQMSINSGQGWTYLNKLGTKLPTSISRGHEFGCFNGDYGLDLGPFQYLYRGTSTTGFPIFDYATSGTPTSYPLSIKWWKGDVAQDDSFAVIQFTQDINGVVEPYLTFTLHKGASFGANVWDLDYVWNGTMTTYTKSSNSYGVETRYRDAQYSWSSSQASEEPPNNTTTAREASYGYLRNGNAQNSGYSWRPVTKYQNNIDVNNSDSSENTVVTYFRDSNYDKLYYTGETDNVPLIKNATHGVSSNANWYKPIKGLPICNQMAPCPYYIPDDFVMIQASVSPGATTFNPGDTVTVSGSEIYEIIIAEQTTNRTSLDNVSGGTSTGMIFAARTT